MNTREPQQPQLAVVRADDLNRAQRRGLAFELWCFRHDRNCAKVAVELGIPERTVEDWRHRYAWDAEEERRLNAVAPYLADRMTRNAVFGADAMLQHLRATLEDREAERSDKTKAADVLLKALKEIAGEPGLAGLVAGMRGQHQGASPLARVSAAEPEPDEEDVKSMSPQEMMAWAERRGLW